MDELILELIMGAFFLFILGWLFGWYSRGRRNRRMVIRKNDGNGRLTFAIQPSEDGKAMELLLTNATLKLLKRGEVLQGAVIGSKYQMIFRMRKVD